MATGAEAAPWRMAEIEERRHAAENQRAEQALQISLVWRPGFSTSAMAAATRTTTTPRTDLTLDAPCPLPRTT